MNKIFPKKCFKADSKNIELFQKCICNNITEILFMKNVIKYY